MHSKSQIGPPFSKKSPVLIRTKIQKRSGLTRSNSDKFLEILKITSKYLSIEIKQHHQLQIKKIRQMRAIANIANSQQSEKNSVRLSF